MKKFDRKVDVQNFVYDLAVQASKKSKVHPVDREFLLSHLELILSTNHIDFLFYNLELENPLYTNQLLVCLPELWVDISFSDLLEMSNRFTNVLSYFTLIRFTYKYLELDIIEPILESKGVKESEYFTIQILEFLRDQWNVLLKTESDFEDFIDGFIGVNYEEWIYVKQRLLLDTRLKPALLDREGTRKFVSRIISIYERKG